MTYYQFTKISNKKAQIPNPKQLLCKMATGDTNEGNVWIEFVITRKMSHASLYEASSWIQIEIHLWFPSLTPRRQFTKFLILLQRTGQKIKYKCFFFHGYVDQEKVSFNAQRCFPFATNFDLITCTQKIIQCSACQIAA